MTYRTLRISLFLLCVLSPLSARAQRYAQDTRTYFDYGETFYNTEVLSADGRGVDVRINTASAMFAFLRSEKPGDANTGRDYYAVRDIAMEVTEAGNNQPITNRNVIDTIYVFNYQQTISKTMWHAFDQHLTLPNVDYSKRYTLRIEIRDQILGKLSVRPVMIDLKLREFRDLRELGAVDSTAIGVSDITLVDSIAGDRAFSHAWGSTYSFSRDLLGNFTVLLGESLLKNGVTPSADLVLSQLTNIPLPNDTGRKSAIHVVSTDFKAVSDLKIVAVDSGLTFERAAAGANAYNAFFTIPGKQLEQGVYRLSLTVHAGSYSRTVVNEFSLMWIGMPVSLQDTRDAMAPMVHILSDADFRDIQRGKRDEEEKRLWSYWKKQDPTPETAFNERMATFYQRVDYAYFNFASGRVLDGAMSDRGKIYILYGPPSKIERSLLPGQAPFEVWTYAALNVRKSFKFVDRAGRGDYKLVDIQNL